jgi:hypothetical protein
MAAFSICLPAVRTTAKEDEHRFKKWRQFKMSTTQATAIDANKLNAFIGQFVTDLGAAVHTGMVVIGEKLGLYKALAERPSKFCTTCR